MGSYGLEIDRIFKRVTTLSRAIKAGAYVPVSCTGEKKGWYEPHSLQRKGEAAGRDAEAQGLVGDRSISEQMEFPI